MVKHPDKEIIDFLGTLTNRLIGVHSLVFSHDSSSGFCFIGKLDEGIPFVHGDTDEFAIPGEDLLNIIFGECECIQVANEDSGVDHRWILRVGDVADLAIAGDADWSAGGCVHHHRVTTRATED